MHNGYVNRQIEPLLEKASSDFPVIVLTGARQTGKSTLLQHMFKDHAYISLDDPIVRRNCREDPALFIENYPAPCIIDEIQYAPEILPYIKIEVDKQRRSTGRYILTGSQIFPLMAGLTETLAGRAAILHLYGMGIQEVPVNPSNFQGLFERIFKGSFPDPLVHKVDRSLFYSSYLQTYVERDIRQIQSVQDTAQFQYFLELLAGRTGNLLNLSEIAKEIGISQPNAKRWLSLLETTGIVYLLRPYHKNISKRIVKSPKLYFTDTGLLSYLLRYPNSETLAAGPSQGAVFENFVIAEFLKQKANLNLDINLYFYRDSNQNEIDLVVESAASSSLYEIKLNSTVQPKHYRQLTRLKDHFPNPSLYLISTYNERIKLARDLMNIPVRDISTLL